MSRTEPKQRSWSREYNEAQDKLWEIWGYLKRQTKNMKDDLQRTQYTLTDEELQRLRIEVSELDFDTGETSPSSFPYFMPTQDEAISVSKSGIDPEQDSFHSFNRSNTRRIFGNRDWPEFLRYASYGYFCALADRQQPGFDQRWEWPIPKDKRETGQIVGCDRYSFTEIHGQLQTRQSSQSHRVVNVLVNLDVDENRPSSAEWIALVTWMLAGMRYQLEKVKVQISDKPTKEQRRELRKLRLHIIFPTLVICLMRPARARVLYGYIEDGILKVQLSKCQDFDGPQYVGRMDCLLRWNVPITNGDTRMAGLQTISEDEEAESDEAEHGLANETRSTTSKR